MDLFDIPAGARWPDEIDRALRSADAIIGVMSPASMASENVKNEWDWAIANERRLILLLVEPCEIPFHYVSRNYIDLTSDQAGGLAALVSAIEAQDAPALAPAVTPPEPDPPPQIEPEPGPLIVGRQRELSQLREALDKSLRGDGQLVLVGGEAGIGKTTLVRAMLREAEQRGCLILTGGCYDLTTTPPHGPWVEIIRNYPASNDLPPLPTQLREGGGMEGIPTQGALFDLVSTFLAEIAARQPLVLLLEDLHWSDAESLALLRYVSRSLAGHRILLVATYRDDELTRRHPFAQLLPRLIREASAERVAVRQLDSNAIRDLIGERYNLMEDDQGRLAGYLEERSEGNPLYVEELLFTLESEGSLTETSIGNWTLGELDAVPVPMLIVQLIEGRLVSLGTRTRELLEVLAVIGQEVEIDLWRQVSEASDVELIDATRQAIGSRIVVESGAGSHLHFYHALVREALMSGPVSLERQRWHRRAADTLIERPAPDPDEVVTHLARAGDPRLIDWLIRAAERAEERLAWGVAIDRLERAVQLASIQRVADPAFLCDLLLELGACQDAAGTGQGTVPGSFLAADARSTYWRAVDAARTAKSPVRLARAAIGLTYFIFASPFTDERVIPLLEEVLARLPDEDSVELALTQAHLAAAYRNFMSYSGVQFPAGTERRIQDLSRSSVAVADRTADPFAMGISRLARILALRQLDCIEQSERLAEDIFGLGHSLIIERYNGYIVAESWRTEATTSRGDTTRLKQMPEIMQRLKSRTQTAMSEFLSWSYTASVALCEGQFSNAEQAIQESDRIFADTGIACNVLFALRLEQDRLDDIESRMASILGKFPASPWFNLLWIRYLLETNQQNEARRSYSQLDVKELSALARGGLWPHVMAQCAQLSIAVDDQERVRTCYELLHPYPDHIIYGGYIPVCAGAIAHFLGCLAGSLSDWRNAEMFFDQASIAHDKLGFEPLVANTMLAHADMLSRRGNPGDRYHALELLDRALGLAREIGMVRLERMATELQSQLKA